jgi:transposase
LRHNRVTAPLLLDGPMNGQTFKAYVEQMLAPTLKRDIVVMDNVAIHKVAGFGEPLARSATLVYLPPYSPGLNPIGQFFSKLKAILRKAAHAQLRSSRRPYAPESSSYLRRDVPRSWCTRDRSSKSGKGLARNSQTIECIGDANQGKLLCRNDFRSIRRDPDADSVYAESF